MIAWLICAALLLLSSAAHAGDVVNVIIGYPSTIATRFDQNSVPAVQSRNLADAVWSPPLSTDYEFLLSPELFLDQRDPRRFVVEVDETYRIIITAGADHQEIMRYAAGDHPFAFSQSCWPTATFRSAKRNGTILANYATVIEDAADAVWSLRLTSAQTAALSGRTGYTELQIPDASCNYSFWSSTLTTVALPVTQ